MLAELVDHVIGVDPDRDWITVAVIEARTSGAVATDRFPATSGRLPRRRRVGRRPQRRQSERAWVIEGTAGYGRGLTMTLQHRGEWVIEFDRAERKAPRTAPSPTPSMPSALLVRRSDGLGSLIPRAHAGMREAIRVHTVTRAAAVRARTAAINELKALIVTADESLRHELRGLRTERLGRALRPLPRRAGRRSSINAAPERRCAPWPGASNISTAKSTTTTGRSNGSSTRPPRS